MNPDAVIATVITVVLAGGLAIVLLLHWARTPRALLALLLVGLASSALVNLLIKHPIATLVSHSAGIATDPSLASPPWYLAFALLLAPVTEEAIKAAPILLPRIRRLAATSSATSLWAGMTLGMSFGIGEAAYIGLKLATTHDPSPPSWYLLLPGFGGERLLATLAHGLMTTIVIRAILHPHRTALLGYLTAITAHVLCNTGPLLYGLHLVPATVAGAMFTVVVLVLTLIFERWHRTELRNRPPTTTTLYQTE
ncbi:hypothetical protein GCM10012275_54110 [Longimycelium tulufanense]|uniref:Uncharacterized protein n=1 Tax=Longimycelium tulufanense TaxID=907463 RepID=A0A8J3FYK4_9PSEU|nr:hypothetical protein [Longimycelium tulufanense]GGM76547.1 hypothetical protein GCM10012275_54110 [Longimycelium tulufanense]